MANLLKSQYTNRTVYINLDTIPVIEHDDKKEIYALRFPIPGEGTNFCELETLTRIKKKKSPEKYKIIAKYVNQRERSKTHKIKIVPLTTT